MSLTAAESSVAAAVAERRSEIVALASSLVGLDTTARNPGDPPRDEAALQELLAGRLATAGAHIDLFEPDADAMAGRPLVPPGLDFVGRPQLIARLPSGKRGRALVFNGHIDVVPAKADEGWTSPPFAPEVRDGRLYGRGACDMKGGVAAMVVAAEVLADRGVLAGELVVATNTDEESSGAGGTALVDRGLRADGAIVTEPTGFDVWVACRGSTYATITVPGVAGHAEVAHRGWPDGGAVNAIDKAEIVLAAVRALRDRWATDQAFAHPYLSPPSALVTTIAAGDWAVTIPATCDLSLCVTFLPVQADEHGFAARVEHEVVEWLRAACATDDWLAAHPPKVRWLPNSVMPFAISEDEPVVVTTAAAARDLGLRGGLSGLDSWYDGATLTVLGGIPAIGFGPGGLDDESDNVAHAVDEHVGVDELVQCAQALAVAAMRFCGTRA